MKRSTRISILIAIPLLAVVIALFISPIPQPEEYHDFADQRGFLGIPNFLDVVSNLPFLLVGGWALWRLLGPAQSRRPLFLEDREKWPWVFLFAGTLLTGFGSAYYHLAPSNETLFWDRLPMAIIAMSLVAAVISERIGVRTGLRWLAPLLLIGLFSVAYWAWTESREAGDLRWYGLVQFLPILILPVMILLFSPRYTRTGDYFAALGWYLLAKVAEALDETIYAMGQLVSGHTIKHLIAALALYWLYRMISQREPASHLRPVGKPLPKNGRPKAPKRPRAS